jgi:hypothetical protein
MRQILTFQLTLVLILSTKSVFCQIYNLPKFIDEITQLYADERNDAVKAKLQNNGFEYIESEPDYTLDNITYKSKFSYYIKSVDYSGKIEFSTIIKDEEIENSIYFKFYSSNASQYAKELKSHFLSKRNYILKKENNWINDTSWISGKVNDDIIRRIHPTYIRIDGNGSLFSKENDFGAQFYINRFVMPLPNFNLRDSKKTFDGKSIVNIPLKKLGKSYYVKLYIGGIGYDFLFDTGASDFLINKKIETNLINAGTIREEDYLENETYEIANGSKVEMRRVKISKLKFGSIYLENIVAGISENNTQPLFGISAMNKFQTWKINNKINILSIKR